jgi:hypothetical protein
MSLFARLTTPAAVLLTSLATAQAFPQDGLFYQGLTCPAEGFEAGGEQTASLSFPTLCLADQCCELSNPINVRDMDEIYLYDATCTDGEEEDFAARMLVGAASVDGLVAVFENTAHTYIRCEP